MACRKATTHKQAKLAAKTAAQQVKQAKKLALNVIAEKMHAAKKQNGGKLPHSFTSLFLPELKKCWPDISRHTINNNYRCWLKGRSNVSDCSSDKDGERGQHLDNGSSKNCPHNHSSLSQIGRPQGTTEEAYNSS